MSKLSQWLRKNRLFGMQLKLPDFATVGRYTYGVNTESVWMASQDAPLVVGSYCSIASGVQFYCKSGHVHDCATSFPIHFCVLKQPSPDASLGKRRGIRVGNDVWIGRNAAILPGVTISDGAVIGAHAVVTKDIPPYAVVAGNPARVVRYRFDEGTISKLMTIRWWDWDVETVKREAETLTGPIDAFIAAHFKA
ncbi:CatB-related O-acetyltransferase [Mesorhizobium sp. WSM4976]|uniref:CatB-related O-acetyltransferase n=1 Tax=Mesorhizobium sp. WSM4976 TaxID=3038549 RepID=UPI0024165D00|nr:CatB-related O-acetyltransferase [Mesorhizobium sp. WSM4976]MDG4895551.1 CatB-related O-acetyltransferase [Mesorhizobium sp. WSM4976]